MEYSITSWWEAVLPDASLQTGSLTAAATVYVCSNADAAPRNSQKSVDGSATLDLDIHWAPANPFTLPYFTVPQKHCNDTRIYTPRGMTFGGSGAINGSVWVRGDPGDYDRWANEDGCTGWSFQDCLPYFKRIETYESGITMDATSLPGGLEEVIEQDKAYTKEMPKYRGDSGPIKAISGRVGYERYTKPSMAPAIIRAGMQAGYPYNPDHNGPSIE